MAKTKDEQWYVIDLDARPPIKLVEPIEERGAWLRLSRHCRVKIGSLAFKGREKAMKAAKSRAADCVAMARGNLVRAERVREEIESYKE